MEINIENWKSDQVVEWLKGLESMNSQYVKAFTNNQIDGKKLLNIRPYELEELGIKSVGHQEMILEAVEHLRNFHYNLDKENLQQISMQINSLSLCLNKTISYNPQWESVNTEILIEVSRLLSKIKMLISWLDMNPFQGQTRYRELRANMLKLGLELATVAQRDRFSYNPIENLSKLTSKLSSLSNYIIQDITDPLLLQPAYLDLVTLKKNKSELGFSIMQSYQYVHRISEIKFNSPAHNSGRVEDNDEIIQVNYQTVIGWPYSKVILQFEESTTDVLLTLKRRPKHTKIYGLLGMIKLPSKKRPSPFRWDNVLPSPRFDFEPDSFPLINKTTFKEIDMEESSGNESDTTMTPTEIKSSHKELRMYMPKPRASVLQRRYTICGDDLKSFQNIGSHKILHDLHVDQENLDSPSLRDKSVSFGFGLELTPRPTTCLGLPTSKAAKGSLPSMFQKGKTTDAIEECDEKSEVNSITTGASKVVRFDSTNNNTSNEYNQDSQYICNVENTIIESSVPIPYADEDDSIKEEIVVPKVRKMEPPKPAPRTFIEKKSSNGHQYVEAVNVIVVNREAVKRGRLDKSHSTPTYNDDESDIPPAIEPRHQQVNNIPPIPPRKPPSINVIQITSDCNDENKSKVANIIDLKSTKTLEEPIISTSIKKTSSQTSLIKQLPFNDNTIERSRKKSTSISMEIKEETELVTPAKVKTLTNRKKNSLMAKRRKVTLKSLGTSSTIQGHLYKRAKDRSEVAYWVKLYFVLIETALYGFKSKESQKADCVIFLSGITVSLAKEVHSKQFAFKVYHPKKSFWFAAETKEALNQWMEFLEKAAMKGTLNPECNPRDIYSETECSEDEDVLTPKQFCTPSPLKIENKHSLNFGSLKKKSPLNGESSSPSEHKFFGFFNLKTTEKKTADIIPTNNFKTYKKVKENNGGMQLGSTLMSNVDMNTYLQSGIAIDMRLKKHQQEEIPQPDKIEILPEQPLPQRVKEEVKPSRPIKKSATPNYLRASNPNLLDFSFKPALDFPIPNYSSACTWDPSTDVHVTLLDLMQQQLDEEKRDMYNKRVEQGIEKIYDKTLPKKQNQIEKPKIPPKPINTDPKVEKIQKRSLPTRPDDSESFNLYDKELQFTRTREGQKLRDFGYELINNEDESLSGTVDVVNKYPTAEKQKPRGDRIAPTNSLKKKSGFTNWITSSEKDDNSSTSSGTGSFRKSKKNENFKLSNEKASKSQNNVSSSSLNFERFLQPPSSSSKVLRKNSAPNNGNVLGIPYFPKLSFSSSSCKEKKILGSPKLHRAIFGSSKAQSPTSPNSDQEIFSTITFPNNRNHRPSEFTRRVSSSDHSDVQFPSYPELQNSLPPVFKPETYSLKKTVPKND